jgi:hypothetical protein
MVGDLWWEEEKDQTEIGDGFDSQVESTLIASECSETREDEDD